MKTQLTQEQSQHLIDLGISFQLASTSISTTTSGAEGSFCYTIFYIFTLTDLLDILPKEIDGEYINHALCMSYGCDMPESKHNVWFAYYDELNDLKPKWAEELIDALYDLLVWVIENGFLKIEGNG